MGRYDELAKTGHIGALLVLGRTKQVDSAVAALSENNVEHCAEKTAHALGRGDRAEAERLFEVVWKLIQAGRESPRVHFAMRDLGEVMIAGGMSQIETLLTFWGDAPVTYGLTEERRNYLAVHAAALSPDEKRAAPERLSTRDAAAWKAIQHELAGERREAIAIWRELTRSPSQHYDYLHWLALARNLFALGDRDELAEVCAALARPPIYRPALHPARRACRGWSPHSVPP